MLTSESPTMIELVLIVSKHDDDGKKKLSSMSDGARGSEVFDDLYY